MKNFNKIVVFGLICMNLCCMSSEVSYGEPTLCPLRPDWVEKLKKEGKLRELTKAISRRPISVDRPLPITKALIGTRRAIVLLVDFSDNVNNTNKAHFSNLLFSVGTYSTGSMRDYYRECSYNKLDINGGVYGWYRASQPYSYYLRDYKGGPRIHELVREVINLADPEVNFREYDADGDQKVDLVIIIHAGSGAEAYSGSSEMIWSHMDTLSPPKYVESPSVEILDFIICPEDGAIGVFAHEVGHLLGLPDLYDTDENSEGIGNWSLMASGSWLGDPFGVSPAHPDAWCKIQMGWVTPNTVTTNVNNAQIPQVETNPTIYKLWKGGQPGKEYFLIENRQKVGFDRYLPGSGLLIYHVDENIKDYYSNSNDWNKYQWYPGLNPLPYNHYLVALEQADGKWELEKNIKGGDVGDPYYSGRVFNNFSTPNSKAYDDTSTYIGVVNISNSMFTMTATLYINQLPPFPFSLKSPEDGSMCTTLKPTFIWGTTTAANGGTVSYTLWYTTDSTFATKTIKTFYYDTYSFTPSSNLTDNFTYYWKVIATDQFNASVESNIGIFYVNLFNEPPGTPTLKWPEDGRITSDLTPTFRWKGVSDPDPLDEVKYTLWYSKNQDFNPKTEIKNITATEYTPSSPLDNNSTYYWKVFAVDKYGSETSCSGIFTLITQDIIVYPNPLYYSKDKQIITFANLPDNSIVKIFSIAGELIDTSYGDDKMGKAIWWAKGIASGIYIYVVESEGKVIKKGKVGILR